MKEHYLISEVASLMGVTIKTLKYYDTIGLLNPEYKDPQTGYRYYSHLDINRLSYILMLKQCSIPLKDIQEYFEETYVPGTMIKRLTEARDMLNRHIERLEDFHAVDEIVIKEEFIPASVALHMHFESNTASSIANSFVTLLDLAVQYKLQLSPFSSYMAVYDSYSFIKRSVPIDTYIEFIRDSLPKNMPDKYLAELPAGHFVTSVLYGSYTGLVPLIRRMHIYCDEKGLVPTGLSHKYYLKHVGNGIKDTSQYITKIAIPVI